MKDSPSNDSRSDWPGARRDAQPWHPADEKRSDAQKKSGPIGTHSFTGGGAEVGQPPRAADADAERGEPRAEADRAREPDPLAEPRASIGEILGRKP